MHANKTQIAFSIVLPSLEVTAASCQEIVVGMPVNAKHSRANRLLDVLAYPPVTEEKLII